MEHLGSVLSNSTDLPLGAVVVLARRSRWLRERGPGNLARVTHIDSSSDPPRRQFGWSDMFVAPEDDPRRRRL
jgi:hypothetical protein